MPLSDQEQVYRPNATYRVLREKTILLFSHCNVMERLLLETIYFVELQNSLTKQSLAPDRAGESHGGASWQNTGKGPSTSCNLFF